MWYWIIKVFILSLIFIFLLHYLYSFFISTLTIPKVKDLVILPQQKYDELFNSLEQNKSVQSNNGHNGNNGNNGHNGNNGKNGNGNDNLAPLPSLSSSSLPSSQSMKDELIRFMKEIGGGGSSYNSNKTDAPTTISSYSFSK
jgi:hypothetical protein